MSKNKASKDPYAERESRRYETPIASREHILAAIDELGGLDFRGLAAHLGIKGQQNRAALQKRLGAMCRDRQLQERDDTFVMPKAPEALHGKVQAHPDGFGFLLLEGREDVFLSAAEMRQVFHGDEVAVEVVGRSRKGQAEGKIVSLLAKNTQRVVGRLMREQQEYYVRPDNPRINHLLRLIEKPSKKIEIGDYVTAAIVDYPDRFHEPTATISEHLGSPLAPGLEIDMAIRSFDLPYEWPQAVADEVQAIDAKVAEVDKTKRVDLRDLPLVTIDGADARDFDDAVYCKKRNGGGFTLWVAIADVSHYVTVNSPLDREAHNRGNSVYFPGRVVPMLPEVLSNGLCSLNPEVDRLCMVCEMSITAEGIVENFEFYEAVMHSHARLTYNEVAEVLGLLKTAPRSGTLKRMHHLMPHLQDLYALYKVLRAQREERGAIDFESQETQIVFDADRKIEDIVPAERNEAHKIIEECMLGANVAAAGFLQQAKLCGLFRNHEGPKPEKLQAIKEYLAELKLSLPIHGEVEPADYQQLIQAIAERPDKNVIQIMLLRSMRQAVYESENKGHFGLAFGAYSHFTSPIRRYPDLLVHRAIKYVIRSRKADENVRRIKGAGQLAKAEIYPYDASAMITMGEHCSMTERRAEEACRDVMAWLKCEYLLEHVGESFTGVVSGVTNFGLFVELEDVFVEGLIHITALDNEYFDFDPVSHSLIGAKSGRIYSLGDRLAVRVVRVDLDNRKVDLELIAAEQSRTAGYDAKRRMRQAQGDSKSSRRGTKGKPKTGSKARNKSKSQSKNQSKGTSKSKAPKSKSKGAKSKAGKSKKQGKPGAGKRSKKKST